MFWSKEILNRHRFSTLLRNMPLGGFRQTQEGLKLNGTHQLLVYADDIYTLSGSIHAIKKKHRSFSSRW
jgi:hypothetical protein